MQRVAVHRQARGLVEPGSLGVQRPSRAALLVAAALACLTAGSAATAELQVVATIKPLHSLVSGVMAGVGEPQLIIRGTTSPHSFTMRPSDARKLENADVVFLIGEAVETSVSEAVDALAADARVVALVDVEGVVSRPLREGGSFEWSDEHAHHGEDDLAGEGDGHGAGSEDRQAFDMHVWLDPVNAGAMARAIADTLAQADSANADAYAANAASLQQRLDELGAEIASAVAPIRGSPFLVFHDAYQHFEDRFGLVAAGSAVIAADRSPGVRRIRELRTKVKDLGVKCVMSEPQFDPRLVHVIVQGSDAKVGAVDPLGGAISSGPELYFDLLRDMAASFTSCLLH